MKLAKHLFLNVAMVATMFVGALAHAGTPPDLYNLAIGGKIMGPGNTQYPVSNNWKNEVSLMKDVNVYDAAAFKAASIICGTDKNRSILFVGEPSDAYRYIFARITQLIAANTACSTLWNVEVDISKIESGHMYVGQVEEWWETKIKTPSSNKDVVLYMPGLGGLIGVGAHSNDDTGIEREYVNNFTSGEIRTVAFVDKYEYNDKVHSKHAYVFESFAEKIVIPDLSSEQALTFAKSYLSVFFPSLSIGAKEYNYLMKNAAYFQPNRLEPERTLGVLNRMTRNLKSTKWNGTDKYAVSQEDLRNAILEIAQVPSWMIERKFDVIRELKGKLDGDVVGVAEGKRDIVRLATNGYVVGRTDDKPIATVLLTGPTGTGKSYIAKRTAEYMGLKLVTFDMTSYKDPEAVQQFIATLSRNLVNNPYAIYLFEEIDKAAIEILDALYFMMDEGVFYDNNQRPMFARGAFVIMTSNAASDVVLKEKDNPNLRKLVNEALQKAFRMSFLNRFDAISIFMPFTDAEYLQLAKVMVNKKLGKLTENYGWKVSASDEVFKYIGTNGKSAVFGARPMERLVENVITYGLAKFQLDKAIIPEESTVLIEKDTSTHGFTINVNGTMLKYEIDPDNNGGMNFKEGFDITNLFFSPEDRMYND